MKPLIVALDLETDAEALSLVKKLSGFVDIFKVGPVLYLKYGGPLVKDIQKLGGRVFLDMKFHDIPSVVKKAVERAGELGIYSATVHASGGENMMREAASAKKRPLLWGVTVLTSLDESDLKFLGISRSLEAQVNWLAESAKKSGLDGVIASAREAESIKRICGKAFQVVAPGIRMNVGPDDQKRAQTPRYAIDAGADFFVMGRPVLEAKDPLQFVKSIYSDIEVTL
jgi:orotidine-5'-phosphate decarboxylase